MRPAVWTAAFVLPLLAGIAQAQEQSFYSLLVDLGERTTSDLRLIEEHSGAKIEKATLDLCFASDVDTSNGVVTLGTYDRVLIPLKIEGNRYQGSAASSEGKRQVAVSFERRNAGAGESKVFSGTITVGGKTFSLSNEPAYAKNVEEEMPLLNIVEQPGIYDEAAAPNTVAVKFNKGTLAQLLDVLRGENVRIDLVSGAIDKCSVLRSGFEYLRMTTPPDEALGLVAKLRKLSFVASAGWTSPFSGSPTVRISDGRWVKKGVVDRAKAAAEFSAAIAKHIGATVTGTEWDAKTGELKARMKRDSRLFPGLGLTENFLAVTLIAPERPGETGRAMIWGPLISGEVADERAGSRLNLTPLSLYAGPPEGILIQIEAETLAGLLAGEWWDTSEGAWTKP